jgi:hypothetical protein
VSLKGHFDEEKRRGEAVKMTFEDSPFKALFQLSVSKETCDDWIELGLIYLNVIKRPVLLNSPVVYLMLALTTVHIYAELGANSAKVLAFKLFNAAL